MTIDEVIVGRITELIARGRELRCGNEAGQALSEEHVQHCRGWLTAASNIAQMIIHDPQAAYRRTSEDIANRHHGFVINNAVGEVTVVLENLLEDAQSGLVSSVANSARAEVFDDFLDHAKSYMKHGYKNEAGVIAGVVFEDSIRQVCRTEGIAERGKKLDGLITALAKLNTLSGTKAKRARVAADVRTKATHAQWKEFDENDVKTAIEFTEELISNHVDK